MTDLRDKIIGLLTDDLCYRADRKADDIIALVIKEYEEFVFAIANKVSQREARIAELEALIEHMTPFAKMGNWATAEIFEHFDLEAGEVFDAAKDFGILIPVPGGFNPEIHDHDYSCAEPGDPWFTLSKLQIPEIPL